MTILLAGLMVTVSVMMMYPGAFGIRDADTLTPDGISELLRQHSMDLFVENKGQWDAGIRFAARTSFGHIAFCDDHILFDIRACPEQAGPDAGASSPGSVVRMDLHDTRDVVPQGRYPMPYRTNILHGNDPSGWGKDLLSFREVVYEDLWDGIDLIYDSSEGNIKYEYRVGPGSDHGDISFCFTGQESIGVTDTSIRMVTATGLNLVDDGLFSYHEAMPAKELPSVFIMRDDQTIGYDVDGRDTGKTLVIDPVIYGTYIGGSDDEYEVDMAMDDNGACYLARSTWSFDFPTTPGAYNTRIVGENDGFVMKIYPDGSSPVYSTYIGGGSYDNIYSIAVDPRGNAYVAGCTESTDFPTTRGAFNETMNGSGQDLVVFKLDASGSNLVYSTYIGGTSWENLNDMGCIAVDTGGCAYVVGSSNSKDFPVTDDAFDRENNNTQGGGDREWTTSKAVLVRLKADGSDLEYSTYLGGEQDEYASGLILDDEGMVYVLGSTGSKDFPVTKGAYDTSLDSWSEIFLVKFDIGRSTILYSTFLGGSFDQYASDLIIDGSGRPYICGWTGSNDFPVMEQAYQRELNGWNDVFVTAFDPTFSSLYMSTLIGGSEGEQAYSIDIDNEGNVMITGSTASPDYPTIVDHATPEDSNDPSVLISVLDPLGTELVYSTLVGGSSAPGWPEDAGFNIFSIGERRVLISGYTGCSDFPITDDAYDDSLGGFGDMFLIEFDLSLPPSAPQDLFLFQGDSFLNLSWGTPADDGGMPLLGYVVYRGLRDDEMKVLKSLVEATYLNDTDLEMGKTYHYMVRALNMVGTGSPSVIVSCQAACSPTPPQFFQVKRGNSWVKLSWEPPVFDGSYSIDGYSIYRSGDGITPITISVGPSSMEYYDSDIINGVNYTYHLTCWNIIGESLPTRELWVIPQGEPSAPAGLAVLNGSSSIHLTWSPPEDDGGSMVLFYRVHIGIARDGEISWRYVNAPSTEYIDTLVEIGEDYRYYVTAVNSEGESAPSVEVEGRPQCEPSPPEDVKVSEGNEYLIITWGSPSFLGGLELQGFRLYRSVGGGGSPLMIELSFEEMLYKDRNVTNGVTYTYWLTAVNSYGSSPGTENISGTPASVPGRPLDVMATFVDGEVVLVWKGPSSDGGAPVLEYVVYRKTSGQEFEQVGNVASSSLTYTDSELEGGTTYTYVVKANNRMGSSPFSEDAPVLALGPPGPPSGVMYVPGDGYVEMTWSPPASDGGSDVIGYIIYRTDIDHQDIEKVAETGSVSYYKDVTVVNGGSYVYAVVSLNDIGESLQVWSEAVGPVGVPGTPGDLVITADGSVVSMTWSAPADDGGSDIILYRVRRVLEGGTPVLVGVVEAGTTSFTDALEKEDGIYTYSVVAVNDIGESNTPASLDIEVKVEEDERGFLAGNIGLVLTVPMIILLLVLLLLVIIRKDRRGDGAEPVPTTFYDQYQDGYAEGELQPINGPADPAVMERSPDQMNEQ